MQHLGIENILTNVLFCFHSWSATQVIGEPDVYPEYGNIAGAWSSNGFVSEWIEVNVYHLLRAGWIQSLAYL